MTIELLQSIFTRKGYIWDSNVNVIGVRNKSSNKVTNVFDDKLYLAYKEAGIWKLKEYTITTDAGKYYMKTKLINKKGCGILKEGQYHGYSLRLHQGIYLAFCQTYGKVTVYRDINKDDKYDFVNEESGYFGVNIHKAGKDSMYVDNYSAACQVFKRESDFDNFMEIVGRYKKIKGNKYDYTLINSNDL